MNRQGKLTKQLYSKMVVKEWNRLFQDPFHRLEYETTLYFLKKYLPKKGLILDAGSGPGRYSIELAKQGYNAILLDLVKENLEMAMKKIKKAGVEKKIEGIIEGSITDLSMFKDNKFDAVVCLGGPLSHVCPEKNREKAVSELVRVVKDKGPVFVSVMGKLATAMQSPRRWPDEISVRKHFLDYALRGEDYRWVGRHYCHFFTIDELEKLFKKNVKILEHIGLEGISSCNEDAVNKLYRKWPRAWKNWVYIHYRLCNNRTVADISQHMMIVARKNQQDF